MRDLIYRDATVDDFKDISKLPENEQILFFMYPKAKYPLDIKQLKEIHKERFYPTLFLINEKIVGYSNLYFHNGESEPYIGHVILDKNYRGRGYGKYILKVMIDKALKYFDTNEVKLAVFSENIGVYSMYKKMGFKEFSKEYRKDFNDKERELVFMKLSKL